MFLIYTCGGDEGLYYSRNAVGLPRNRRDGYTYGTGPCGCGWQCSTLYGVALCGCGRRWPRGGDGGWAGGAGGSCLSRGATGTLTVYCSQARCPLPGYPFPDGRVTAGTGCNAVGPRGGLPTQTSGLWLSDWTKRTLVLPKSLLWRPYAEALGPSKGRKTRLLEPFGRRFFGPLHKPGGVS